MLLAWLQITPEIFAESFSSAFGADTLGGEPVRLFTPELVASWSFPWCPSTKAVSIRFGLWWHVSMYPSLLCSVITFTKHPLPHFSFKSVTSKGLHI